MQRSSCFVSTLKDFERGGIGQVAESKNIFSQEVFLPHSRDLEFMRILNETSEDPFMIIIVGIPGVGKTSLLLTLLRDELPTAIKGNYEANSFWLTSQKKYSFLNFESSVESLRETGDQGRIVWVVPTIDKYYSPESRTLGRFLPDLQNRVKEGESIIIAGNVGVLGRDQGVPKILEEARNFLYKKNQRRLEFKKVPDKGLWIKEYGGHPTDTLDKDLFGRFSIEFLNFLRRHITECYKQGKSKCKDKLKCERFKHIMDNLVKSIDQRSVFFEGIYGLVCAVRLKHRDVYFTPRTLLAFWAYTLDNVWERLNASGMNEEAIMFSSVFESRLLSNYDYRRPAYELCETGVDMFRSEEVDEMLSKTSKELEIVEKRSNNRLNIYFKRKIKDPMMMIYDGLYSRFLDDNICKNMINEAFKHFFKYRDEKFQKPDLNIDQDWSYYTFSIKGIKDRKRVYVTNREAIDNLIYYYLPLEIESIDFERTRSRKVLLRLKGDSEPGIPPHFIVNLDVFWTFLRLYQGFHVDLSSYPHVLVKIEKFLSDIEELTFPFLSRFFRTKGEDKLTMGQNKYIHEGIIQ